MDQTTEIAGGELNDDIRELVLGRIEFANGLARQRYHLCGQVMPLEELEAEARLALVYAGKRYDLSLGVPFGAYATRVIRHRLNAAITSWWHGGRLILSFFTDLEVFARRKTNYLQVDLPCQRTREPWQDNATQELLEQLQRHLPSLWFELLQMRYAQGHSLKEISTQHGLSIERVRILLRGAVKRARKLWDADTLCP